MKHTRKLILTLAIVLGGSVCLPLAMGAPTTQPATQPTADDVQAAIDHKDYAGAVKLSSKLLQLHGSAASGIDRFQVTLLKGEALIGTKSVSTGIMTMKSAQKETKDPREIALGKWTVELFHTAGGLIYSPKPNSTGQKRGPFDLTDIAQRKDAFGVLLDDNLQALEPKIKAATVAQSLMQIWPVLQQLQDLAQLDQIANSNQDKTTMLASSLLDHSYNLLNNAVKGMWSRVGDIDAHANIVTTTPTELVISGQLVDETVSRKNGLSESNKRELADAVSTCQKIHDAAEAFIPLSKGENIDWGTLVNDADRTAGKAADVAAADYGTQISTSTNTTATPLQVPHR